MLVILAHRSTGQAANDSPGLRRKNDSRKEVYEVTLRTGTAAQSP